MNSIYDEEDDSKSIFHFDEELPSEQERKDDLADTIQYATRDLQLWKKRFWYSTLAFFLSCALVVPFLAGHSLHTHWDSFGKYIVLLSMALLLPFVACACIVVNAWKMLHDLKKSEE